MAWKTIDDFQRCTEDRFDQDSRILFVFVSDCRGKKIAASLASLKKSCSDFLQNNLENPPGGDSRLDMKDTIDDFQICTKDSFDPGSF